jgi:hypothetical protein
MDDKEVKNIATEDTNHELPLEGATQDTSSTRGLKDTAEAPERAILVALDYGKNTTLWSSEDSLR